MITRQLKFFLERENICRESIIDRMRHNESDELAEWMVKETGLDQSYINDFLYKVFAGSINF